MAFSTVGLGPSMCVSIPAADLIDVLEEVGRIFVDATGASALELLSAVAAGEEADAEGTGTLGCQHVPDAVADDEGRFYSDVQPSGRCEKEVRIRLAVFHLVPRHDRDSVAVNIDPVEKRPRDFAPPAGRD